MAHNNIEVEIKVPLTKKSFLSINKKLESMAQLTKTSQQVDVYYSPQENGFLQKKYPYEWLSLRIRDEVAKLNYKHWYPEGVKYTTHCDEYETVVEDPLQVEKMLTALKYEKLIEVVKKRKVYIYDSELEIALDTVRGLGYFIEVESLMDYGGVNKTRKKIISFMKELGINRTRTVSGGYAAALMRKKGLLNNL